MVFSLPFMLQHKLKTFPFLARWGKMYRLFFLIKNFNNAMYSPKILVPDPGF